MIPLDDWYLANLVCPVDRSPLAYRNDTLISEAGRRYPVVEGVPVMLVEEIEQTIGVAEASIRRARGDVDVIDRRAPELHLESLGISEEEKRGLAAMSRRGEADVDPVVAFLIGATNGFAYKRLIGNLKTYPIPELRLGDGHGKSFLDAGCGWGRWCIAAQRLGYATVGLDPSLGAVLAARRAARQLGLKARYLVGDVRRLPFRESAFDAVFSYSVLQHFSKDDVGHALKSIRRVLVAGGESLVQMPNAYGLRSLQHQLRRGFREPRDFEVRYWGIRELLKEFNRQIGPTKLSVDCYFGLGLQSLDRHLMPFGMRMATNASELLRRLSGRLPPLRWAADSVYLNSFKTCAP